MLTCHAQRQRRDRTDTSGGPGGREHRWPFRRVCGAADSNSIQALNLVLLRFLWAPSDVPMTTTMTSTDGDHPRMLKLAQNRWQRILECTGVIVY